MEGGTGPQRIFSVAIGAANRGLREAILMEAPVFPTFHRRVV